MTKTFILFSNDHFENSFRKEILVFVRFILFIVRQNKQKLFNRNILASHAFYVTVSFTIILISCSNGLGLE